MKELYNKSNRNYVHTVTADGKITTYRLKPKSKLNVPDDIAKIWLLSSEIMEVGSDEKDKEIARLKAELAKKESKEEEPKEEESRDMSYLDALKEEAKKLGIKGYARMKLETLKAKIEEVTAQNAE